MIPNRVLSTFPAPMAAALIVALTAPGVAHAETQAAAGEHGTMHVTKSPTCGCCAAWVDLARKAGYEVTTTDTRGLTGVKLAAGPPGDLWACHTAVIENYVVEGHVPFAAVARLLAERPEIDGIAVPGMPAGSPGMGDNPAARYDVIAFGGYPSEEGIFYRAGS